MVNVVEIVAGGLLTAHATLVLHNANEAETRKKLIDKIVEDVLEWDDTDISYEERVSEDGSTTYADYIIRTADMSLLIEAKRIGRSFDVVPTQKRVKLTGRIMEGDTGAAIVQARDYCRKKSIPFAVVTNGAQWIIFPAVRTDAVSFSDSYAIVFDSLSRILGEELEHFVDLLSRTAVVEGNLAIELIGRTTDQFEARRLNKFFKGSTVKRHNPIYPLIENEVISAFSDSIVGAESSLLEKCYVKNADRQKFDNRIRMHLQHREPLFSTQPKKPMRKKEASSLVDSIVSASASRRPLAILILGTVGTGKTTFLQYTRKVASAAYFEKNQASPYPHWVDIDFRNFSASENPLELIYAHLFTYLNSDPYFRDFQRAIRPAYRDEIEALKSGPMFLIAQDQTEFDKKITELILIDYNAKQPYVDKMIAHGAKHAPIFLVIDNVDQFEDDSTQSRIFSDAMAIAGRLSLNLIISMRESTYVEHRGSSTFDAFDFDPLHIEPPEIPAVLSRRFFMTGQMLSGKSGSFTTRGGVNFKVEDLSVFIDIVKASVLGTEIGERIDVLANHDVRLALRMTREFLARGYTDPAKALQSHKNKNTYVLPKQEAFRSILLGNQSVYSEEFSVIGNPFDSRLGKSNGGLLRMFILSALVKQNNAEGASIDGPDIRANIRSIGFSEEDTLKVLSDLTELRFIHTKSHGKADLNSGYYASRLGGHVVRALIADLTFIENILMDTFISDKEVWDRLRDLTQQIRDEREIVVRMQARVERAKLFYRLMADQYLPLLDEARKRGLDPVWLGNPLEDMRAAFEADCAKALHSAQRLYGKQ
ncbi:P-loop NTPase fold protein [Pseudomonas syringae group genomosp. 7]|nr:P-loop NTPase fold protein [Pseudomonas syringae group genomosp. 7]